tara:strand:- start:11565 stop:12377 length:813 start_codon:yes stop_codon:yes gene_type:complete
MSSRSTIWVRDALVLTFSFYVVISLTMAPWNNLAIESENPTSCNNGCAPVQVFPDNGYYHYSDSVEFEWVPVSVSYRHVVLNSSGSLVYDVNITENESQTPRLSSGNYTSNVYYVGMYGSLSSDDLNEMPLLFTQQHTTDTASKFSVAWPMVTVSYGLIINLNEQVGTGEYDTIYLDSFSLVHQVDSLDETKYTYSDFVRGETYSWTVYAVDSEGFTSEYSEVRSVNIDTTKFLAFELFNDWEVPFILLGVLMVIALQAGVFLAREERDD